MICDLAVFGFKILPAPVTATKRGTLTIPVYLFTKTSAKLALKLWLEYLSTSSGALASTLVWNSPILSEIITSAAVGRTVNGFFDLAINSSVIFSQASFVAFEKLDAPIDPTEPAAGGKAE